MTTEITKDFFPLQIPPGVFRGGNEYQAKGAWYDTNLVRWYDGVALGPILGWSVISTTTMTGAGRAITAWRDNSGVVRAGIGTHSKLYAMSSAGVLTDITPASFTSGREDATSTLDATVWDLDIWGQYLVGCSPDDGKLYEYQNSGVATQITNAPTDCAGLVVAPQRLLIALGAGGNPRKFQWSGQEDNTVWTASATNQAGSLEIPQGKLVCGRAVGNEILLLSDIEAHVARYVGLPFVFNRRKVGDACGALSKRCIASTGSMAAWWSKSGFWMYDGAVRPLQCSVWDDLRRTLNTEQQSKITAWHNADNLEIWWMYPGEGATEVSRYVFWNYLHNHWGIGSIVRLAGVGKGIFTNPLLVGSDGNIYEHETGYAYDGDTPYARSGPVEIGNGETTMRVLGIVADEKTVGDVNVSFHTRMYPNATETISSTTTLTSTGKADLRFTARQAEIVVTGAVATNWRWGTPRLAVRPGGRR